ncbi:hypothetical protein BayCH28_28140 [Mycolicibacterium sp. CH28]|uniref:hypothetical protein n=1 Tax=Mycolicibacterium sp. CH28 TaxID=2512237 RepID=UPI00108118C2|nr:hypothetical protein [Mycolicibacterium sp. CH28]TGD83897.1 hypothetical protein BayCH28_28140 [Mycolicibacterium sp. CH28]
MPARSRGVDGIEFPHPAEPTLELPVLCFDVERPLLPKLGPVPLWFDDAESPVREPAWAMPVVPASELLL